MSVEETRKTVLSVAKLYLGYHEGYNNDTIFGNWYGMPNQPWCAMFVSFCMYKAGVSQETVKKFASCTAGWNWFANRGETRDRNYVPQKGDIIFFDWDPEAGNGIDHVGLVDRVEDNKVYTVEGNHNDQVNQYNYPLGSNQIWGYVIPSYTGNEKMLNVDISGITGGTSSSYPTIAKGSTGTYVKQVQEKLIQKGYSIGAYGTDGIFGSATEQAVKNFQADNGLVADGIVGTKTWEKLGLSTNNIPSTYPGEIIGMGARGENVVKIQNELMRRGYTVSGGADGQFGSGCKAAVIQFQKDNGLSADGIVGKMTWDRLFPQSGYISSYPGFIITMGSRGVEVEAIQKRLIDLGYTVPGGVDGQFGSGARNAVRQFQGDHGLTTDGDVGKQTWDALFPQQQVGSSYPGYLMGYGMSDNNILLIQQKLSDLGYAVGNIDGIFGDNTKNAVIKFQLLNQLTGDGIVGEATWNKLFGGPVSNPQEVTDSLKEKNNPVFQMIERLYAYAGEYVAQKQSRTATNREKNLLVLQYLRYEKYGKDVTDKIAWSTVCEKIDEKFIKYVDQKNDNTIDRTKKIYLKNNMSIELSHLAVTLETNVVKKSEESITNGAFSDLAGWAGDLITFAKALFDNQDAMNWSVDMYRIYLFNAKYDYSFDVEDLYQDMDAINMSTYLDIFDIGTIFRMYYDIDRSRMAERRFSLFLTGRITNGLLPAECSEVTTTEQKLYRLAKKYLVRDFNSINGTLSTAFSFMFKATYDNNIFAPKVAEAFAKTIVAYAYDEAQ